MTYTRPTSTPRSSTRGGGRRGRGGAPGAAVRDHRGATGRAVPRAGARQARVWSRSPSSSCSLVCAVLAPLIAPDDPNQGNLSKRWRRRCGTAARGRNPMGTDWQGYDVLSRLLYGARTSLFIGTLVVVARRHVRRHHRPDRRLQGRPRRPLADGLGRRAGVVPRPAAGDAADRARRRHGRGRSPSSSPSTGGWSTPA